MRRAGHTYQTPFLNSSTAPVAMLNTPVLVPPAGRNVPALTLTVAVTERYADVDRGDGVRLLVVGSDIIEIVRSADAVLDEGREGVRIVERAIAETHVYHLNGTVEALPDNAHRSAFVR